MIPLEGVHEALKFIRLSSYQSGAPGPWTDPETAQFVVLDHRIALQQKTTPEVQINAVLPLVVEPANPHQGVPIHQDGHGLTERVCPRTDGPRDCIGAR